MELDGGPPAERDQNQQERQQHERQVPTGHDPQTSEIDQSIGKEQPRGQRCPERQRDTRHCAVERQQHERRVEQQVGQVGNKWSKQR